MNLRKLRIRTMAIILLIVLILSGYTIHLFAQQIVKGEEYAKIGTTTTGTVPIPAARGIILDRNGAPLVLNETRASIVFESPFFPADLAQRNTLLDTLIALFEGNGADWIDMLPIGLADGEPVFLEKRENDIAQMKGRDYLKLNEYATARNCMDALIEKYALQEFEPETARKIASVQYNMWRMDYRIGVPYTFAKEVPDNLKSRVLENSATYQGVTAQLVPIRGYTDPTLAPHILGRVAGINKQDYERFKGTDRAYRITDDYGDFGIERAAEEQLRGKAGQKTITVDRGTRRAEEEIDYPAVQGNTVVLTIDTGLQKMIETNFPKHLEEMSDRRFKGVPPAGAVVVLDVRTFEILACVSYPGFDISKYQADFAKLSSDEEKPLWDRALRGAYEPGSTSKVSVALAALQEGTITESWQLRCTGTYRFLDSSFNCPQLYLHRGKPVNVVRALVDSCNSFFYDMGRRLQHEKINEYRMAMGLGQKTGVELPEEAGVMDSREYREQLGQMWYAGNNLQTAIGQGNLFTPLQMAVYTATIANNGTRMKAHIVQSVRKAGSNELVYVNTPEVLGTTGVDKKYYDIVKKAMRELITQPTGTPHRLLYDLPVAVAGKTGTSQVTRKINGKWEKINHGLFISFAPYDNPEIAVIAIGEGCTGSAPVIPTVRDVYEYYYGDLGQMEKAQREGVLL